MVVLSRRMQAAATDTVILGADAAPAASTVSHQPTAKLLKELPGIFSEDAYGRNETSELRARTLPFSYLLK